MGLQDLINKYDNGGFSKTGWFQLKDDGDTATVRLLHKGEVGVKDGETDYDFPIYEVHKLDVDGSGRDRTCLCKGESCEFCKSGNKPQLRMFLQMINKDEKDKDKQVQLWERGLTDIKNLIGLAGEYGDLTKRDIKIKRSGAKGILNTTYQYFPTKKEIEYAKSTGKRVIYQNSTEVRDQNGNSWSWVNRPLGYPIGYGNYWEYPWRRCW